MNSYEFERFPKKENLRGSRDPAWRVKQSRIRKDNKRRKVVSSKWSQ